MDLATSIREITPEEVAFYEQNGWVMLRELFSRELVAELLDASEKIVPPPNSLGDRNRTLDDPAVAGSEPFRSVAFSPEMGRIAHALVNRKRLSDVDIPIQFHSDALWCKEPGGWGTLFHQDDPVRPGDRAGVFNLWLALDEVTPDMGAMRFLSGAHREGPLGNVRSTELRDLLAEGEPGREKFAALDETTRRRLSETGILDYYPKLTDLYEWSPPFHYQPGDATVHHGWMVHGGPDNTTDRNRWAYILEYMPADTEFFFDHETRLRAGMNQHGLPESTFPIVFS
jgi:Phytanoyl-CoA dioxygenase (PhyH)